MDGSVYLSINLSIYLPVYLPGYLDKNKRGKALLRYWL